MWTGFSLLKSSSNQSTLDALYASAAIAEFSPQGLFINASPAFLKITGYKKEELLKHHHSLLMPAKQRDQPEYAQFWKKLRQGKAQVGEYHRISKTGQDFWVQGSYMPVRTRTGKVAKIIKVAFDVTASHQKAEQDAAVLSAINNSQAAITFKLDGTIVDANPTFLKTMGYSQEEITGKHHSMFVDPVFSKSDEYKSFWERLRKGEFFVASYHRLAKGNRDVWLYASYNPVFDPNGNVSKVVKIASDITPLINSTQMIKRALNDLAARNLCAQIDQPLVETLDSVRIAFNDSMASLRSAVSDALVATNHIDQSAKTVSQSTDHLSRRAEQQAASLEQTAAALEQITDSVQRLTNSTAHMRSVAEQANSEAASSSQIVEDAVHTMSEINQNSTQISNIIGVIDEIALQTNLLALNAGVEAARAGDAGRGFAVVATEVRALAQRSAEAAKEIKMLITTSGSVVAAGVTSVTNARQSLELVSDYIQNIDQSVSEAATGAKEQFLAISQVNAAIIDVDKMTQANAAATAETAMASQDLAQELQNIKTLLGQFNVGQTLEAEQTVPVLADKARKKQSNKGF